MPDHISSSSHRFSLSSLVMAAPYVTTPIPFVPLVVLAPHAHHGPPNSHQRFVVDTYNVQFTGKNIVAPRRASLFTDPALRIIFDPRPFSSNEARYKWIANALHHLFDHTEPIARAQKKSNKKRKRSAARAAFSKRVEAAAKRRNRGPEEKGSPHERARSSSSSGSSGTESDTN